jgi:hypothetical protein
MAEILEPSTRKRKLAAILHADVVGFSCWMGEDEAGTHRALGEFHRAVDPLIAAHCGRIDGMGPLIAREARCISTAQFTASTLKKAGFP